MRAAIRSTGSCKGHVAVLASLVVAATSATVAAADPFPAQHFQLTPVAGEPLRHGFVEVIHPDGPQVYAHHVYQLNGARPDASYAVVISIWTSSLACEAAPTFVLPVAEVTTTRSPSRTRRGAAARLPVCYVSAVSRVPPERCAFRRRIAFV